MQSVFFSMPLDPIEQSLSYLDRLNINWDDLDNHEELESIIDMIPICYKFGILTQESYDRIYEAKDTNSVATIIDTLFCSDLITFDNANYFLEATLSLKDPLAVAGSMKILGANNLLTEKIFTAIIKHPNHKDCFERIYYCNSENALTFDTLDSILFKDKISSDNKLSEDELTVIKFGSMNVCRLL